MVTRMWGGVAAGAAAVGLVVACSSSGGSSGGTGPGAISSVDSSKKATDLSEADAQQYCRDTLAYQKSQISEADTKRYTCAAIGAAVASFTAKTDEEAKAACVKSRDECIAKPSSSSQGDAGPEKDPCANAKKDLGNCTATVAEINQCTADQIEAYKAVVNQDPCASATAAKPDGGQPTGASVPEPASCKVLKEKCPALYGDEGSGGSGGGGSGGGNAG